jgi:hypothetical protein
MKSSTTHLLKAIFLLLISFYYQSTSSQVIDETYLTFKYVHLQDSRSGNYLTVEGDRSGSNFVLKPKNYSINQIFLIRTWRDKNNNPNGYSIETGFKEWGQMLSTSRPYTSPGRPIMTWDWLSGQNQYWKFYKRGMNRYIIMNRYVKKGKGPLYIGRDKGEKSVKQTRYHKAITWRITNAEVEVGMRIKSQGGTIAKLYSRNKGLIVSYPYGGGFGNYNFEKAYKALKDKYHQCIELNSDREFVLDSAKIPNKEKFAGRSDWRIPTVEEFKKSKHFFANVKNTAGYSVWLKDSKCNGNLYLGKFRKDGTFSGIYAFKYDHEKKGSIFLVRDFNLR